jgi:L-asparagine transporter-like permease
MIGLGKSIRAGVFVDALMALVLGSCKMQIRLSQHKAEARLPFNRRRSLLTLVLIIAFLAAIHTLFPLQPDNILAAALLFLPVALFAALGAGRELSMPSLTELAFYSFAIVAGLAIWPSARLAVTAYEASGFVTLFAFMGFVFALAIGLGVVAVKLLAGDEK